MHSISWNLGYYFVLDKVQDEVWCLTLCQTSLVTLCAFNRKDTRCTRFLQLIKDESGVTAIEYGLIAALIASPRHRHGTVGTNLSSTFSRVAASL